MGGSPQPQNVRDVLLLPDTGSLTGTICCPSFVTRAIERPMLVIDRGGSRPRLESHVESHAPPTHGKPFFLRQAYRRDEQFTNNVHAKEDDVIPEVRTVNPDAAESGSARKMRVTVIRAGGKIAEN